MREVLLCFYVSMNLYCVTLDGAHPFRCKKKVLAFRQYMIFDKKLISVVLT